MAFGQAPYAGAPYAGEPPASVVVGQVAATLGGLSCSSTASAVVSGAASKTMSGMSRTIAAGATVTGTTNKALANATLAAAGTEAVSAHVGPQNHVQNSSLSGAEVGTPGTLPPGCSTAGLSTSTITVQATGTRNGIPYVRLRVQYTNGGASNGFPGVSFTLKDVLPSTPYAAAIYAQLISSTGVKPLFDVQNRTGAFSYLSQLQNGTHELPTTWSRMHLAGTTHASASKMLFCIDATVPPGQSVDWVIEVGCPQLEPGTRCGDPVLTAAGVYDDVGYRLSSVLLGGTAAVAISCNLAKTLGSLGGVLTMQVYDRTAVVWATLSSLASENRVRWSEDLSNPVWSSVNGTAVKTATYSVAPNGTTTGSRIDFGVAGNSVLQAYSVAVNPGDKWVVAGWFRRATTGVSLICARDGATTYEDANTPLPTGDEWTFVQVSRTFVNAHAAVRLQLLDSVGGGSVECWGLHLAPGDKAREYLPTQGTTRTQAAHGLAVTSTAAATVGATLSKTLAGILLAATGAVAIAARLRSSMSARATTNLTRATESIGVSPWSRGTGVTITPDAAVAPDGSRTADLYTSAGNGSAWQNQAAQSATTSNDPHVSSIFVKKGTLNEAMIQFGDGPSTNCAQAYFNLDTQVMSAAAIGSGVLIGYGYEDWGDGWYRIWVSGYWNGTVSYLLANARFSNIAGTLYFWGAQLERGTVPTPYLPNASTSAAASRSAWGLGGTLTGAVAGTLTLSKTLSSMQLTTVAGPVVGVHLGRRNLLNNSTLVLGNNTANATLTHNADGSTTITDSSSTLYGVSGIVITQGVSEGKTYTAQVEVKKETSQTDADGHVRPSVLRVQVDGSPIRYIGVSFNARTGAIAAHSYALVASGVVDQGNGYWLVWWTFVCPHTDATVNLNAFPAHDSPGGGASGQGFLTVRKMQFEEGNTRTAFEDVVASTQGRILADLNKNLTGGPIVGASLTKTLATITVTSTSGVVVATNLDADFEAMVASSRAMAIRRRRTYTVRSLKPAS